MKKLKRKKNKVEREIFHNGKLNEMKNSIQIHKNVPLYNIFFDNSIKNDINSHCDINIYDINNIDTNKYQFKNDIIQKINRKTKKPNVLLSCKKIIILPDYKQKKIILNMFEGYRKAYNLTLKFITPFYISNADLTTFKSFLIKKQTTTNSVPEGVQI